MANYARVRPSFIGTRAELDAYQAAAAPANKIGLDELVLISDEEVLAYVTETTTPGTTAKAVASAGTASLPEGTTIGDVLIVGDGPAIGRHADLGFDSGLGCVRVPRVVQRVIDAGNLTPAGTAVAWQPAVGAGLVKATFNATVTLNQPTTALPAGTFADGASRVATCRLQLLNTHATRPQRVVKGTIPVIGEMPDLVARAGRSVLIDLQNDGTGWAIVGRNAVAPSIDFAAGFNGETVPQLPDVILEQVASRELFVPADFAALGRADCYRPSGGAAFQINLRRLTGSTWETLLNIDFAANGAVGVLSMATAFPNGATIAKDQTYGVVMPVPASAANVTNLRGSIPVLA